MPVIEYRLCAYLPTLKRMEKKGFLKTHPQTGQMVTTPFGGKVLAAYVQDALPQFVWEGRTYVSRYKSGSFYPYIYEQITISR